MRLSWHPLPKAARVNVWTGRVLAVRTGPPIRSFFCRTLKSRYLSADVVIVLSDMLTHSISTPAEHSFRHRSEQ